MLVQALERLERGDRQGALEALVEAWRRCRSPRIAEAVDAVDLSLSAAPFRGAAAAWAAARERATTAVERGPLLRAIAQMSTSEALGAIAEVLRWDDPRLGTVLLEMLATLRVSGARARTFWRDVCATIPLQRDPRFLGLLASPPPTWTTDGEMGAYLTKRVADATRALVPVTLTSSDEALVAKILTAIPVTAHTTRGGDELLAAIYADPFADAPRHVYADWLLEQGDPRGELIALQLKGARDKAALRREKELLKAHRKEWLGGLAPIVGGALEFRRGFLAVATAKFKHQADVEQYGALPEWATVEELDCGSHVVRDGQEEWARWVGPAMRGLRVLRGTYGKTLLAAGVTWSIERLELLGHQVEPDEYRALLASPLLPRLRRVTILGGRARPSWLEGVERCPPELAFSKNLDAGDRAAWLAAAERTRLDRLIFCDDGGQEHVFSRDSAGRLALALG